MCASALTAVGSQRYLETILWNVWCRAKLGPLVCRKFSRAGIKLRLSIHVIILAVLPVAVTL